MKLNLTSWLNAGLDDAILHFVKGGLRFAAAAGIYYAVARLSAFHPGTPEAVAIVGLIDRLLKSGYVWLTTGPEDTVASPLLPDGEIAL